MVTQLSNLLIDLKEKIPTGWLYQDFYVTSPSISQDQKNKSYVKAQGCQQRQRSINPYESGYYDFQKYKAIIRNFIERLPQSPLILDLGCGDGRFSKYILDEYPDVMLVSVDFNLLDLTSLWASLSAEQQQRNLPIWAAVEDMERLKLSFDGILMMEVACTLSEPQTGYRTVAKCLKEKGVAIVSNVAKASYFTHALLNNDWDQIKRIVELGKFVDTVRGQDDCTFELHLFDSQLMEQHAHEAGLVPVESFVQTGCTGLSIHALRQNNVDLSQFLSLFQQLNDQNLDIPRLYIDLLVKASSNYN